MTRQRGGATRRRGNQPEQLPSSPVEIGRLLREAREQRGLDLLTVHDRLDRPITLLEALETGDLASQPDQAFALSTLRRYAELLVLDGDALALQMIEAWSKAPVGTARPAAREAVAATGVVTAVTSAPDHLRAFTQTGQTPRVVGVGTAAAGGSAAYDYGVAGGPPTGTLAVVPRHDLRDSRRAVAKARRRERAPKGLKIATWVTLILVLVVLAGSIIQLRRPQLFASWHVLHISHPGGSSGTAAPSTAPPGTATSTPKTKAAHPAAAKPVRLSTTDNQTGATYVVDAQRFTVAIATSGLCWVQVSGPSSIAPISQGIQQAGQLKAYKANGSLTVQVGSSAVEVAVSIKGKRVFVNVPKVTPFTYTFTDTPGTGSTGTGSSASTTTSTT